MAIPSLTNNSSASASSSSTFSSSTSSTKSDEYKITDAALACLASLPLTRIDLSSGDRITDKDLAELARLTSLTQLNLEVSGVSVSTKIHF